MVTEPTKPQVIRSSYCYNHGDCVEVERRGDLIAIRNSSRNARYRGYQVELIFTPPEWAAFVAGVKAGEFDPLLGHHEEVETAP